MTEKATVQMKTDQQTFMAWLQKLYIEFPNLKVVPTTRIPLAALTFGNRIFVKPTWKNQPWQYQYVVMRHEAIHLRQQRSLGFGSQWLGAVLFALLYGLVLPVGLAYFRWRFERVAYLESLAVKRELGDASPDATYYVNSLASQNYFWAWPKSWVRKYFAEHS